MYLETINNETDKKIVSKNIEIVFTSTNNQKINDDKNNVTMNLGHCENILKYNYNISIDDSLYIIQYIAKEEGIKIPKLEYEVYYSLYNNIAKLNLSFCQEQKISISIKVKINDSIDKYDSNSDYYNDLCSTTTSESGTDITLNDRRNEFVDNKMSLCEENCELIDYNTNKEKALCSCEIKTKITPDHDIKFNETDFFRSFIKINDVANIKILKCYKIVFKLKNLVNNYGFYVISFIIIIFFITLFTFIFRTHNEINKDINNMILIIKNSKETQGIKDNQDEKIIKKKDKKYDKKRYKKNYKIEDKKHDKVKKELKSIKKSKKNDKEKQTEKDDNNKSKQIELYLNKKNKK